MKLQISFDLTNLADALAIAHEVAPFADILEIGTILLYKEGVKAIEDFKSSFPKKQIFVDTKISDRAEEVVTLCAKAGGDILTVLAGTSDATITKAAQTAHERGAKIALDLIDAYSMGQSARNASTLGIDLLLFHRSHEEAPVEGILDEWEGTRGNTKVPIYVSGHIKRDTLPRLIKLKPQGFIIGRAITKAKSPAAEAEHFYSLIHKSTE